MKIRPPDCEYCGNKYEPAPFRKHTCAYCGAPLADLEKLQAEADWQALTAEIDFMCRMSKMMYGVPTLEHKAEPRPWWQFWKEG